MNKKLKQYCEEQILSWSGDELTLNIPTFELNNFYEVIGDEMFEESGIDIQWTGSEIFIDLVPICEFFEIDPEDIEPRT